MDDSPLIRRAQQGDMDAIAALYDRYHQAVFTYLALRLNDDDLAADLTGEVFVRMVQHLPRFQARGKPLLAWLYTVARNLLAEHHRQQGKMPHSEKSIDLLSHQETPLRQTETHLAAECLQNALQTLTPEQQEVIILRFVEERRLSDVAALLEKTTGAVKALQHRALAALRRAIEKAGCYEP